MTSDRGSEISEGLGKPARRALSNAGIETAEELARYSREEISALHGIGPSSLPTLDAVLEREGLAFRSDD